MENMHLRREFSFINQVGSSVIDYVLTSDAIINNATNFKTEADLISSPTPL
jgi:hypothetical protein